MLDRVLVVLPNWYGETLFATPFLAALRRGRPDAVIATVGRPQCREVLLHNPDMSLQFDFEEDGAHRGLAGKWRLVHTLRSGQFDTAFILRRSLSRTLLLAFAGIPNRIGFANRKSGWLLTRQVAPCSGVHKAASYLPLLAAVGLKSDMRPYTYTVHESERLRVRVLVNGPADRRDAPVVVLHPGANWAHKRWPPERFAELANRLADSAGAQIVITGGPSDGILAESIRGGIRSSPTVLAGRTTLRELAACLEQAHLVVANDTGVLHLAAALGRSVVALYGPTSPALTGPLGDPRRTTVLHHADCCPRIPCYAPERPPHPGMNAITVEEVYAAATRLLERPA